MDVTILPTKKIINTARAQYKRYSLPVAEPEPTDIKKLQFFYIGTQTRNIEKLKEYFEFGYTTISAESAIFTLKRLLKNPDSVTIPDMIIAEGTLGTEQLVELHQFIYAHKIMAAIPFIVEATGLSKEESARFKRYTFIDELLFLNEFTAPVLLRKTNFLKNIKQKWVQEPASCKVETSFRAYPDARAVLKRGLDLLISSALLAVLGPLMLLIALAMKLDTGGPVLYTTLRTGRGYRIFHLYKFNTIIQDADKKKNGATISRVGLFIRKTCLDELPQLLNVWLGDLSLVGQRALPLYEASQLTTRTSANYFLSAAGLTGWQVQKVDKATIPAEVPLVAGTATGNADKSDLLYDIWLMANKQTAIINKTNA
ncbi:sugar transferase [Niastella caeni]|uniref:Sugar transferase n=1 Tax=Niastella caeni TaxID=2569763 RepID=A0A4S8HG76_9BACT|nr:sugar transferase [Niastella caeni]THU33481.1 sugar transferase [Niastella caeni]